MRARLLGFSLAGFVVTACGGPVGPPPRGPCFQIQGSSELRAKDATKALADLEARISLSPEEEALRHPKSLDDVRAILRRDVVYLFEEGAAFAHQTNSREGRFAEAYLELLLGESQLVASQVLGMQAAWVSSDMRIGRATLATERAAATDRARLLAQLVRAVEEGNAIADALGVVGPMHLARGAEVIRTLRAEVPDDARTFLLLAEYHRLRGEWAEFDAAITAAEAGADASKVQAVRYLRAMEQLERHRKPDRGAAILREALAANPKFVRAQAALVLMAKNPRAAMRELARLKAASEDHYLVMLLEPTLAAEQELLRIQNAEPPADVP
jgi:hypothetical protein